MAGGLGLGDLRVLSSPGHSMVLWCSHKTGQTFSVLAYSCGCFMYVWDTFYMYFMCIFIEIEGLEVHTESV